MTTNDLVLCTSPEGWSLHAPGSTDEDIAAGDAILLASGEGRPDAADYARALADLAGIRELARQDQAGEVDDSYARTGDAMDTIRRWRAAGRSANDRDLVELIDRVGVRAAAQIYQAARS